MKKVTIWGYWFYFFGAFIFVGSSPTSGAIPVIMAVRIHLFPFRTQKLSSLAPMVLTF